MTAVIETVCAPRVTCTATVPTPAGSVHESFVCSVASVQVETTPPILTTSAAEPPFAAIVVPKLVLHNPQVKTNDDRLTPHPTIVMKVPPGPPEGGHVVIWLRNWPVPATHPVAPGCTDVIVGAAQTKIRHHTATTNQILASVCEGVRRALSVDGDDHRLRALSRLQDHNHSPIRAARVIERASERDSVTPQQTAC